jgi:primosomal protein N' (replication factor Y)
MYAEVVVDRPILKRDRRSFVDAPGQEPPPDAAAPLPETEQPPDENPLAVTFHYHVPAHLQGQLQPGHLVAAPFRTQQLTAIVVALSDSSPVEDTRPIAAILDPAPVLTPAQLDLARWLSAEYLAPLAICLRYFLPPGSGRKPEFRLKLTPAALAAPPLPNAPAQILLTYLCQHGPVRLDEVDPAAADLLLEKGLAQKVGTLSQPRVGPKLDQTVELLITPDEVEAVLPTLGRTSKQADLLLHLADLADPLPPLADTLAHVGCTRSPAVSLEKKGWVQLIPAQTQLAAPPGPAPLPPLPEPEQAVLDYLREQKRPVPEADILAAAPADPATLARLKNSGLVVQFNQPERIALTLPPERLTETIIELRRSQKQAEVLKLLALEDGPVWVGWVYAQTEATRPTLTELAQANLISLDQTRRWRDPLSGRSFQPDKPPQLTPEQQAVWQEVARHWTSTQTRGRAAPPVLLHGVTGSGKTEIYLRAIAAARRAGQGAIMLVPEISLAAQTVQRVGGRFPGQVAVWHSALSPGERFDTWERVRRGDLPVVVGPRSALFAPVPNLGVIIVDEEHEPVYKQRDRAPIFHAREAAVELGRLCGALVILGSATPDVVSYRLAERGRYRLLSLPSRILAHTGHSLVRQRLKSTPDSAELVALPLPPVSVVDMREELKAGNRTIFCRALQEGIRETLGREEQVILFLNRRGTASFVICRDCGYVMACPRCETSLTYHASGELMVCHYCGYRNPTPDTCPACKSRRIRYFGLGTQRVEDAVKELFPQAQTIRWDWDTTRQKGSHDLFLHHFAEGKANVMVGTQMIAKGLDLPLVTLVGVISADTALYLPDFRAGERTFQLLMQVAGRAGRSPLGGRVIVQTYNPDRVPIEAAANHDYEGFYQTELAFRREQQYPPFKRLALLLYTGPGPERSAAEARRMAEQVRLHVRQQGLPAVEVIGPTPGYVRRVRNQYRWHILVRAQHPADVLRPLMPLPHGWRVDIDPVTLL